MTEKTFNVLDMSCDHCKAAVEGGLKELPGVEKANADVVRGTVEVSYDQSTVNIKDLKVAIEEAGYTVDSLEADTASRSLDSSRLASRNNNLGYEERTSVVTQSPTWEKNRGT